VLIARALQVAHDELAIGHQSIQHDYENLSSRFDEQRSLNDRLENDLLRINDSKNPGSVQVAAREDPLASLQFGKKVGLRSRSESPAFQARN